MSGSNRHGTGIYYYTNGDIYAGEWRDNVFQGRGRYIFAGGEYFEGDLVNGKKHGVGKYVYINGNTYDGDWAFDKKNGLGVYKYWGSQGRLPSNQNATRALGTTDSSLAREPTLMLTAHSTKATSRMARSKAAG
jgi:hypothetical protein